MFEVPEGAPKEIKRQETFLFGGFFQNLDVEHVEVGNTVFTVPSVKSMEKKSGCFEDGCAT